MRIIKKVAIYNENCIMAGQVAHEQTLALHEEAREEHGDVTYLDEETAMEWAAMTPTHANRWMRKAGMNAAEYLGVSLRGN